MTIEIQKPDLKKRVLAQIQSGRFNDVDELFSRALDALERESELPRPDSHNRRLTAAVSRILASREHTRLPETVTVRDLLNEGRD